jgi:SAM-dependent methyltransferase
MDAPQLVPGSRWQETDVVNFILSLRRLDVTLTDADERALEHYARYHARRFALVLNAFGLLIPEGAQIFSVGSMPNQLELLLAREFDARVVGSAYNPLDKRDKFTAVYQSSSWRYEMEMYLRDCSRDPIPAEKESCDLVFCFEVVEHFLNSPESLFREVSRVLRPGGHLLLSTPNLQHWHRLLYWINGITYPDTDFREPVESRHTHIFSLRELKALLNTAGLEVVSYFFGDPWQTAKPGMQLASLDRMALDLFADREEYQHECIFIAARPVLK